MSFSDLPNAITVLRLLLVPPFIYSLLLNEYTTALIIFAVAGGSDGLDGFLARRFDWESEIGALLDPIADKILMFSAYFLIWYQNLLPTWLTFLVIVRDVIILAGASLYRLKKGQLRAEPLMISKINTALQIILVVSLLAVQDCLPQMEPVIPALMYTVALTTLVSGILYIVLWTQKARSDDI